MQTYSRPPRLQPAAACGALLHRPGRLGRHRLPQRLRRGLRLPRRDRYARRLRCDACRVAAPRQEELDDDLGALCAAARLGPGLVRGLWQAHRGVSRAAGDAALGLLPAGRAPRQGQQRQRSERRGQRRRCCGGGPGEQGSCTCQEEAVRAFRHTSMKTSLTVTKLHARFHSVSSSLSGSESTSLWGSRFEPVTPAQLRRRLRSV